MHQVSRFIRAPHYRGYFQSLFLSYGKVNKILSLSLQVNQQHIECLLLLLVRHLPMHYSACGEWMQDMSRFLFYVELLTHTIYPMSWIGFSVYHSVFNRRAQGAQYWNTPIEIFWKSRFFTEFKIVFDWLQSECMKGLINAKKTFFTSQNQDQFRFNLTLHDAVRKRSISVRKIKY